VAHVVAHQWWGVTVGNDPARDPILTKALANWSALSVITRSTRDAQAADAWKSNCASLQALSTLAARIWRPAVPRGSIGIRSSTRDRDQQGRFCSRPCASCLGDQKFFAALGSYYKTNQLEVANMNDLRALSSRRPRPEQRRV